MIGNELDVFDAGSGRSVIAAGSGDGQGETVWQPQLQGRGMQEAGENCKV